MPVPFTEHADGVSFALKVVPGASRDAIAGPYGDGLKVRVAAPPEAGAANDAVVRLLAATLGVPMAQVRITRGHTSPRKQVCVSGVPIDILRGKLDGPSRS
jgi:uncharacterized protein (TIGR00251 family)